MEIRENGVRYILQNNEVIVIGVDEFYPSDIVIPSRINNSPVVKICEYAFTHTNIMAITIPNTIQYIDRGAFFGCGNLRKFKVHYDKLYHQNELTICDLAFSGCLNMVEFSAIKSLTKLQTYSLEDCFGLKDLKTLVKDMQYSSFKNCESLNSLIFADKMHLKDLPLSELTSLSKLIFKGDAKIAPLVLSDLSQSGINICCKNNSNLIYLAYNGYNVSII